MSSTGKTPDFIRHTYTATSELKSYTVYKLVKTTGMKDLLTYLLRIEKCRGKSNSTANNDYLRLRTATNWFDSKLITGLRPTIKENLFYGEWRKTEKSNTVKTLLIFSFSKNKNKLVIDVYRGFYPIHNGILQSIINTY
jgi:hypothetical protein